MTEEPQNGQEVQEIQAELVQAMNMQIQNLTARQLQVVNRIDEIHSRQTDIVVKVEAMRGDINLLMQKPNELREYQRSIIPIAAIFVTMLLASFGLNLTTLIFIINHVTASHTGLPFTIPFLAHQMAHILLTTQIYVRDYAKVVSL